MALKITTRTHKTWISAEKAVQPLTAKRKVTGSSKMVPTKTPHRLLSHAAALPLPPSPPASTDVDLPPATIHDEPKPRPPPQPPPDGHAAINPELAAAAAVPLPPSPATAATHNPKSPPHQPQPPQPPAPTATQLLALQTRALQSSYVLAASRAARAKQTQHANSQLVALHERVAADRSALADAELGVIDARRAINAVGPLTAAEGRLRELVAVIDAFDGAYAKFVGAVRDSVVVKMPSVGLRMDRPAAAVGRVLDAAAAVEPLATVETLATVLTDTRAVAEAAAKEMRECQQLAAELRAAKAVQDSHAIGREQRAASALREGDELAWLVVS
ncbi:hypothetical protein HDU87_006927 [Geranomyces variabilis]|uniref:Uncharacterized protein n=1 Tax=Geranomyces variabilis TaxID=109894 RepID=A0AAD5TFB0_9FUNG|nr:hypothetical protein HDU87_006927 [Geranomyces variabilis]